MRKKVKIKFCKAEIVKSGTPKLYMRRDFTPLPDWKQWMYDKLAEEYRITYAK